MGTVFRKGLESKLNSTEMEPCKVSVTLIHIYVYVNWYDIYYWWYSLYSFITIKKEGLFS